MCVACANLNVRATDGRVLSGTIPAVRVSAAHDLGCTPENVDVMHYSMNDVQWKQWDNAATTREWFVTDGCGRRLKYAIAHSSRVTGYEVVQIAPPE
jgi:hypothetical protein